MRSLKFLFTVSVGVCNVYAGGVHCYREMEKLKYCRPIFIFNYVLLHSAFISDLHQCWCISSSIASLYYDKLHDEHLYTGFLFCSCPICLCPVYLGPSHLSAGSETPLCPLCRLGTSLVAHWATRAGCRSWTNSMSMNSGWGTTSATNFLSVSVSWLIQPVPPSVVGVIPPSPYDDR